MSIALIWIPLILILAIAAACGGSAPEPIVVEKEVVKEIIKEVVVQKEVIKEVPVEVVVEKEVIKEVVKEVVVVATPTAMAPAMAMEPVGALNVGQSSLGTFIYHPSIAGNPAIYVVSTTMGEALVRFDKNRKAAPMLAESWSIGEDTLTWTFNIRPGVQFHKGYGELTADDIIYSYQQWGSESSVHARASFIADFWTNPEGSVESPDTHTVVVKTAKPWISTRALEFMRHVGGTSGNVVSKKQSEELGIEKTSRDTAMTGSWELVETKTGEFWRMKAVQNHWRKTPAFAEMTLWEIPEESARLAGFQTGQLDTFIMSFDNIPQVEKVEGALLNSVGLISQAGMNVYGQLYTGIGDPDQKGDFDGDRAWVSANADVNSPEWANARKVREAMTIAIDRQTLVDTLLAGFGAPLCIRDWGGYEHLVPADWTCDYDPERAKQLLAEAGYPDGFTIDLTTAIRGVAAEPRWVRSSTGEQWRPQTESPSLPAGHAIRTRIDVVWSEYAIRERSRRVLLRRPRSRRASPGPGRPRHRDRCPPRPSRPGVDRRRRASRRAACGGRPARHPRIPGPGGCRPASRARWPCPAASG